MAANLISRLRLGQSPRVVGTIITPGYLERLMRSGETAPLPFPSCDLVELRVDGFPEQAGWVQAGEKIEAGGTPVFATVRLAREGGHWKRADDERWPLLESALRQLSGCDVELESELAARVCSFGRELGKMVVVSHHNFERTPPPAELEKIMGRAAEIGSIAKIAAKANTPEDLENLRALLHRSWGVPVCVIAMGEIGRESRLKFPLEGSCLTYGYLDIPGAPGQYSAQELREYFAAQLTR